MRRPWRPSRPRYPPGFFVKKRCASESTHGKPASAAMRSLVISSTRLDGSGGQSLQFVVLGSVFGNEGPSRTAQRLSVCGKPSRLLRSRKQAFRLSDDEFARRAPCGRPAEQLEGSVCVHDSCKLISCGAARKRVSPFASPSAPRARSSRIAAPLVSSHLAPRAVRSSLRKAGATVSPFGAWVCHYAFVDETPRK